MQTSIYRIIDANFNRSREACRVMEEFARFVLCSKPLAARAKQLRHKISSAAAQLDSKKMLAARESDKDPGAGLEVFGQMKRTGGEDVFAAAAKRLPEALRVLAETAQTISPESAGEFEKARFQAYTLEKDIARALNAREKFENVRLYVLLDAAEETGFEKMLSAALKGGADCIQLRAKNQDAAFVYRLACILARRCREAGAVSIVNDRPDIAVSSGADGVHLGLADVPAEVLRDISTRPMVLGLTTHNIPELEDAIKQGADYVGIGPFAQTQTKPGLTPSGLTYIKEAVKHLQGSGVYHTAIGGINAGSIPQLREAGVRCAAVSSAVTKADNPEKAAKELKNLLLL
ncbi:Thiamine-phosphate synthase [Sedimentisphaera cyanobacteriorum]|uniref:Thiamine-phosphate synthase n=1 Tax=Sedimentisphaera cyanobacteriorum TaxID=1940790 RepID=A0A1Q2HS19_9BACT|nr:thiamine phosphate synthase [Sedimentisphaera cyanobacteriorum]AQQ10222.1 Thiamine-phosphate synthase [Sedimentisphaera cyanobacteriorum]